VLELVRAGFAELVHKNSKQIKSVLEAIPAQSDAVNKVRAHAHTDAHTILESRLMRKLVVDSHNWTC
jgi:hypothetical protein